jgi:hypothetical protein
MTHDPHSPERPETLTGASVQNPYEPYPNKPYTEKDLPMTVWLRGDEPYCDQFILDAEQVMALLGIKRSRLTQISGKELRVGRMRMGRYIRPVFRQRDVESYKEWVRPTTTHKKSSHVINEAAEELASQAEELARLARQNDFKKHLGMQHSALSQQISAQLERLRREILTLQSLDSKTHSRLFNDLEESIAQLGDSFKSLMSEVLAKTPDWADQFLQEWDLWRQMSGAYLDSLQESLSKPLVSRMDALESSLRSEIHQTIEPLKADLALLLEEKEILKPRRIKSRTRARVLTHMGHKSNRRVRPRKGHRTS